MHNRSTRVYISTQASSIEVNYLFAHKTVQNTTAKFFFICLQKINDSRAGNQTVLRYLKESVMDEFPCCHKKTNTPQFATQNKKKIVLIYPQRLFTRKPTHYVKCEHRKCKDNSGPKGLCIIYNITTIPKKKNENTINTF